MKEIFVNKQKLELAQVEAAKTGGDVKDIYLRMKGLIQTIDDSTHQKEGVVAKVKKVLKKKKK